MWFKYLTEKNNNLIYPDNDWIFTGPTEVIQQVRYMDGVRLLGETLLYSGDIPHT
jgi:hypothetical protein